MGETCEVCGREKVVRGQGFQEDRCWRGFTGSDDTSCYRLGYERSQAALAAARRECEGLRNTGKVLLELIDHADGPTAHGPWCNGVHEMNMCEGEVRAAEMISEARAALAAPAAGEEGKR